MDLKKYIRDIPDFPKPGIVFKDITPLLKAPEALDFSVAELAGRFIDDKPDLVAAVESRGFIFGAAAAIKLGAGFIPIRKPGKLPYKTARETYTLEYGEDIIEIHQDACCDGEKVLIIDDLLATGGTVAAARRLIEGRGATVCGAGFVIELGFLKGRNLLDGLRIESLIDYDGE